MEAWSDARKWWMGLLEKFLTATLALVFGLFFADRYQAAQAERQARQESLAAHLEGLSRATLDYAAGLYDAYYTPCGKEGRSQVHRVRDEHYFAFINALEATERMSRLFAVQADGRRTRALISQGRAAADQLYREKVKPRLDCGCAPEAAEIDDRVGPPSRCSVDPRFNDEFGAFMRLRNELLASASHEYRVEASRSFLGFVRTLL